MKKTITILTIMFLLISCRSVKKDKESTTEVHEYEQTSKDLETQKEDSNTVTIQETQTNSQTATVTTKTTTRPINPDKTATVTDKKGNKTILDNAEIIEEETKTNNATVKDEKLNLKEQKEKIIKQNKEESKKELSKIDKEIIELEKKMPVGRLIITFAALLLILIAWLNRVKILSWFKKLGAKIWWV